MHLQFVRFVILCAADRSSALEFCDSLKSTPQSSRLDSAVVVLCSVLFCRYWCSLLSLRMLVFNIEPHTLLEAFVRQVGVADPVNEQPQTPEHIHAMPPSAQPHMLAAMQLAERASRIVDMKKKIPILSRKEDWSEFRFRFEDLCGLLGVLDALRAAANSTPEQLQRLSPDGEQQSQFIFSLLFDACTRESLDIVRLYAGIEGEPSNGMAAWHALCNEYEPKTAFQ